MNSENFFLEIRASFCNKIKHQKENTTDKRTTFIVSIVSTYSVHENDPRSFLIAIVVWKGTRAKTHGALGFLRETVIFTIVSTSNPVRRHPIPKDVNHFLLYFL